MEIECGSDVTFEGAEYIATFESSTWGERGFCKKCGSHLFMRAIATNEYGISPGLFDNDQDISFNRQVFFDKKPSWYSFANVTRNITSEYIYSHYPQIREDRQKEKT